MANFPTAYDASTSAWSFLYTLCNYFACEAIAVEDRFSFLCDRADDLLTGVARTWFNSTRSTITSFDGFAIALAEFKDSLATSHSHDAPSSSSAPAPPPRPPTAPTNRTFIWNAPLSFAGFDCPNYRHANLFLFAVHNAIEMGAMLTGASTIMLDTGRIRLAMSCLTGAALAWASVPTIHASFTSYAIFKSMLITQFSSIDASDAARLKLNTCSQTTTVEAYVQAFRHICSDIPDLCPREQFSRFIAGLKQTVRLHTVTSGATTYEGAVSKALLYERTLATYTPANPPSAPQPPPQPARPAPRLNALNARPAPVRPVRQPLTPAIMDYLRANNGCFYCRELGHSIEQCQTRPQRPNARPQ
jgi:hypothetical protein